ncbi:olfactory receptor 6B1-like [Pogona vitticeps]
MQLANWTQVSDFILIGFPGTKTHNLSLFIIFLAAYVLTVMTNVVIIVVTHINAKLHKPMYLFLSNLSFLELWYVSVTIPKILASFVTSNNISFIGCMAQLYFFVALACTESVLLTVMAYDRYVAVCNPLRYPTIMTQNFCICLAAGSWMSGFLTATGKMIFIARQSFCGPNIINHFFCDVSPVLHLACSDMSLAELMDFLLALIILLVPLAVTIATYICIIATILHIPSAKGKQKAFSTCTSHLVVVTVFYSTTMFIYVRPRTLTSFNTNKLVSVFYTVLTPLLNPVIYCLRNKEFKEALSKTVCVAFSRSMD